MEELDKLLPSESEERLLRRNYMYWSQNQRHSVMTTAGSILEGAVKQLNTYMKTVAMRRPNDWDASGILDSRIKIEEGSDRLQGHVVMGIGRKRIIVRSTKMISTSKEYNRIQQC